jgi:hypothetical protein
MAFIDELKLQVSNTKSELREVVRFGFLIGGVSIGVAVYVLWRWGIMYRTWFIVGGLLVATSFIAPKLLKPFYRLWMFLGFALGSVVSRAILLVLFYVVVTPLGLMGRLVGKRFLDSDFENKKETYWRRRQTRALLEERFEKQF